MKVVTLITESVSYFLKRALLLFGAMKFLRPTIMHLTTNRAATKCNDDTETMLYVWHVLHTFSFTGGLLLLKNLKSCVLITRTIYCSDMKG